jgi:cysteine synthase
METSARLSNAPLVRLNRVTEGARAMVLAKLESFNPVAVEDYQGKTTH